MEPEVGARKVRRWCEPGAKGVECLYRYDKGRKDLSDSDQFKLRYSQKPRQATKALSEN